MRDLIFLGESARIALPMMQAARAGGAARCILIGDAQTAPLRESAHCDQHIHVELNPPDDARLGAILSAIAAESPDAVLLPFDCAGIRMAARHGRQSGLQCIPVPDMATLDMLDDKWQFHAFCQRNHFTVPASRLVESKHAVDFAAVSAELGLPFVMKPLNCSGSVGVQIIRSQAQFSSIMHMPEYNFSPLIIQQFIAGEDIDLSLHAVHGRLACMAIQQTRGHLVHFVPNEYLEAVATPLCEASGYHGVMHIDARLERGSGKVFLIECNPRFWASLTASAQCGLNFVSASLNLAATETVQVLNAGTCSMRHPLLRPALWWSALFGRNMPARLTRARAFDFYTLRELRQTVLKRAGRELGMAGRPDASPKALPVALPYASSNAAPDASIRPDSASTPVPAT